MSRRDSLAYLVGRWHAEAADQFREPGITESTFEGSQESGAHSLVFRGESHNAGRLVNSSIRLIIFDTVAGKFVRKCCSLTGFINNEEGDWDGDTLLFDVVKIHNEPASFRGVRWRSFIRKYIMKPFPDDLSNYSIKWTAHLPVETGSTAASLELRVTANSRGTGRRFRIEL